MVKKIASRSEIFIVFFFNFPYFSCRRDSRKTLMESLMVRHSIPCFSLLFPSDYNTKPQGESYINKIKYSLKRSRCFVSAFATYISYVNGERSILTLILIYTSLINSKNTIIKLISNVTLLGSPQ